MLYAVKIYHGTTVPVYPPKFFTDCHESFPEMLAWDWQIPIIFRGFINPPGAAQIIILINSPAMIQSVEIPRDFNFAAK